MNGAENGTHDGGSLLRIAGVSLAVYACAQAVFWLGALAGLMRGSLSAMAMAFPVAFGLTFGLTLWGLLRIVRAALDPEPLTPYRARAGRALLTLAALCAGPAVLAGATAVGAPIWFPRLAELLAALLVPGTLILLALLPGLVPSPTRLRRLLDHRVPIRPEWLGPGIPMTAELLRGDRLLRAAQREGWVWSKSASTLMPPGGVRPVGEVVERWQPWLRELAPQLQVLADRGFVPESAEIGVPRPRAQTLNVEYVNAEWRVAFRAWGVGGCTKPDLDTSVGLRAAWAAPSTDLIWLRDEAHPTAASEPALLACVLDAGPSALAERFPRVPDEIRVLFEELLLDGWWREGASAVGHDDVLVPGWSIARDDLELVVSGPHPVRVPGANEGPGGWSLSLQRNTGGIAERFPADWIARTLGREMPVDWAERCSQMREVLSLPSERLRR